MKSFLLAAAVLFAGCAGEVTFHSEYAPLTAMPDRAAIPLSAVTVFASKPPVAPYVELGVLSLKSTPVSMAAALDELRYQGAVHGCTILILHDTFEPSRLTATCGAYS